MMLLEKQELLIVILHPVKIHFIEYRKIDDKNKTFVL